MFCKILPYPALHQAAVSIQAEVDLPQQQKSLAHEFEQIVKITNALGETIFKFLIMFIV